MIMSNEPGAFELIDRLCGVTTQLADLVRKQAAVIMQADIPDETKESANFIYAFLQSELAKNQLSKQVFGSVIDEISPESVGKLLIPDIGEKSKKKIISQIELFREQTNKCILCYRNAQQLLNNELNHI